MDASDISRNGDFEGSNYTSNNNEVKPNSRQRTSSFTRYQPGQQKDLVESEKLLEEEVLRISPRNENHRKSDRPG